MLTITSLGLDEGELILENINEKKIQEDMLTKVVDIEKLRLCHASMDLLG